MYGCMKNYLIVVVTVRVYVCVEKTLAAATVVEKSKRRAGERRWCTVYRAKQTEN